MSIVKMIFLAVIAIIFFQFVNNSKSEFDGALMVPPNTKVLAFGDSITSGYRVDADKNYPSQLSKLLQVDVINAGISGEETRAGLRRLPALLDKYKPEILIICHGGNDILRRRNFTNTKENIAQMIKLAQERKIHVVLVGVPMIEILRFTTASFYYELANEFNVPLEDKALTEILYDDALKFDKIHPNAQGYTILSNNIAQIVTDTYTPKNF